MHERILKNLSIKVEADQTNLNQLPIMDSPMNLLMIALGILIKSKSQVRL
jgi:hypothetical protein